MNSSAAILFYAQRAEYAQKEPVSAEFGDGKASPILKNRARVENFSVVGRYAVSFSETRV